MVDCLFEVKRKGGGTCDLLPPPGGEKSTAIICIPCKMHRPTFTRRQIYTMRPICPLFATKLRISWRDAAASQIHMRMQKMQQLVRCVFDILQKTQTSHNIVGSGKEHKTKLRTHA